MGWLTHHEYPSPVYYAPELLRDRTITRINRHYLSWIGLGLLIPTAVGLGLIHGSWLGAFLGFLWGGLVRMFLVDNSVLSINSFSHVFGSYDFETDDHSRNNPWVALPTFGESWQNNHHAFASSAAIGLRWWQIDFGYWLIAGLSKLGVVWDVGAAERGDDEGQAGDALEKRPRRASCRPDRGVNRDVDTGAETHGRRAGRAGPRGGQRARSGGSGGPQRTSRNGWSPTFLSRLGIEPHKITTTVSFARYGLDSSAGIALTSDLSDWLGRELDPTLNYSYPTIAALAKHLAE